MSVIVELSLPATTFQLGEILAIEGETRIMLNTMVPLGERSVPFFRVHGSARESFEASVHEHPAVSEVHFVNTHGDETLYALDWEHTDDAFLSLVKQLDGHVLEATGSSTRWNFQLRFSTHDALSTFQENCVEEDIAIDISRIYNPTISDAGRWYGLTSTQRETLQTAVKKGYYSIPRRTSTETLAEEFNVSDTAITERLRRGIETLVTNTLLAADSN